MVESPGKCVDTSRTWSVRRIRNKINGEKNCLCSIAEKKLFAFITYHEHKGGQCGLDHSFLANMKKMPE